MASTPSSRPSRRIVSASTPSASTSASAAFRMRSRDNGVRRDMGDTFPGATPPLPPSAVGRRRLDAAPDEVVLAVQVAVERHGLVAELAPAPPHRERLDALGVDHRERSLQDAFTGQRRAPRHGRHLPPCHPAATTLRRRATTLRRRSGVAGEPGAGATVGSVHRQVAESRGGSAMAPEPQSTAIEELLVEDRTFPPPEHFKADALVTGAEVYDEAEKDWQGFWARQAA